MDNDPAFNNSAETNVIIEFDSGNYREVFNKRSLEGNQSTIFSFRSPYRYTTKLQIDSFQKAPNIKDNNIGAGSTSLIDERIPHNYAQLYSQIDRLYKDHGNITYNEVRDQVLGKLNQSISAVLDLNIHDHGDVMAGRGTLYFIKSDQPKEFEFNVLSSGEKEVIDILIDTYLKKDDFNDSIYLIDEPELHINTGIQRRLLQEIVNIIPSNCQLWIATHSLGFLNALKQDFPDEADIIWFEGNYASRQATLHPINKTRKNWKRIFETALEDLTGLISPKQIIYCEGRKEPDLNGHEQGFDAEVYNIIFENEFPDALFVSSGGSTEPDKYAEIAIKVLGKAFDSVDLLLLKDKDINPHGSLTTDEERQNWIDQDPQKRRMLSRKEIENFLFDAEVLTAFYPELDMTQYNNLVPDINNGEVKGVAGDLKALCGANSLNKEDFKVKLAEKITPQMKVYKVLKTDIFMQ